MFQIYVQQRLRVHFSYLLKVMLQMTLLLTSILCGITRVRDNKHHTSDVMAGFIVGSGVAIAMVSNTFLALDSVIQRLSHLI